MACVFQMAENNSSVPNLSIKRKNVTLNDGLGQNKSASSELYIDTYFSDEKVSIPNQVSSYYFLFEIFMWI